MYIPRIAEDRLKDILTSKKVGIILGARQVGKTTLVERVLSGAPAVFLNFDIAVDRARFVAASALPPEEALKSLGSPELLVIDEAQRLPETARTIKGWYDSKLPVQMLLLGSSSLNLLDQTAESLTGRNRKLQLPPLTFTEAVSGQSWASPVLSSDQLCSLFPDQISAFLMQRMVYGSYPEVVLAAKPQELLRNLSSDYLWKDVLQAGQIKSPDLIQRLLKLLAHQVGTEVSVSELATQLQIARQTVDRYLDLLQQTYVIFQLPAFSNNPRKEIAKSHKLYFWDTGIRNALLNTFSTDPDRPDIGALWENWVIAEAAKHNLLNGAEAELYFWRTRSQSGVDLVVTQGSALKAYEIKWRSRRASARAFKDAYGVDVEVIRPVEPFAANPFR